MQRTASPPRLNEVVTIHDDIPAVPNDAKVALVCPQPLLLRSQSARLVRPERPHLDRDGLHTAPTEEWAILLRQLLLCAVYLCLEAPRHHRRGSVGLRLELD